MDVPVTPRNEPFNVPKGKSRDLTNPAGLSRHAGVIVGDDVRKLFEYARANKFALPAINVTSTSTATAALQAAQDSKAPIILQISSGGSEFVAGKGLARGEGRTVASKHDAMVYGSIALAHYIRTIAPFYGIPVVLHTDHCHPEDAAWLDGLLAADIEHNFAYQARLRGIKEARDSPEVLAKLQGDRKEFVEEIIPGWKQGIIEANKSLAEAQETLKTVKEPEEKAKLEARIANAQKTISGNYEALEHAPARIQAFDHQIALLPKAQEAINREIEAGLKEPLFSSHMIDFSPRPTEENIKATKKRLQESVKAGTWLEMEIGITGGAEDGKDNTNTDKARLYTNPKEIWAVYDGLRDVSQNFSIAAAFGNVHGVYKPGSIQLRPWLLGKHQKYVKAKIENPTGDIPGGEIPYKPDDMNPEDTDTDGGANDKPVFLVFHGGSGSDLSDFQKGISHGVVKVNIDTDTQWAYCEPVRNWIEKNLERLRTNIGSKDLYDPRKWLREAELGMKARVQLALDQFNATGKWDWDPTSQ